MELQFTKDTHGMWVSEFEVNSDFNLHIERTKGGIISLYQRTTGGGWDHVDAFEYVRRQASIDFDCTALVYPKWCKIESEVEPSYAAITTDGEVTEIKSQSKEVEITANGVTEIAPDNGFGYLSGVKVNVNVPQGGGESGGGDAPSQPSGGNNYVYLDWDAVKQIVSGAGYTPGQALVEFGGYAVTAKMKVANKVGIVSLAMTTIVALYYSDTTLDKISSSISALAVDLNVRIFEDGELMTVGEILGDGLANFPQITEEEFYNLDGGGINS